MSADWMARAACAAADPDVFHPEHESAAAAATALRWCRACPVTRQCLDYAMTAEPGRQWGVWGGATARQRRAIHRDQHRQAA